MPKYVEICSHPKTVILVNDDVIVDEKFIAKMRKRYHLDGSTNLDSLESKVKDKKALGEISKHHSIEPVNTNYDPWY